MSNKLFMGVMGAVLIAALGVGGAFAGGVAYERNGEESIAVVAAPPDLPSPSGTQAQAQTTQAQVDPEALADLRARLQSGDATPEDLQQLRQQFAGQAGGFGGAGGGGFGGGGFGGAGGGNFRFGGGGLSGTIESIEGDTVTVNTAQGPLQVILSSDTTITSFVEVEPSALTLETRISVNGQRNDAGVIEASTITITPEGFDGGGGGGFRRGLGGQAQQTAP